MATPNYKPFIGQLSTSRYDFQAHIEGAAFRHNAYAIDVGPTVTYPTAAILYIKGIPYYTVADALYALAGDITSDGYAINSFIYRAGSGLTGPVIFGTFDGAVNAANTLGGAESTIIVDDTGGLATASGHYDLSGVNLLGINPGSTLTFQNGSTIIKLWYHLERLILASNSSTPIIILPASALVNIGFFAAVYGSSSAPFFIVNSASCSFSVIGGFLGDATNAAVTVISSITITVVISIYGGINNNALSGAGGAVVSADWSVFIIGTQSITFFSVVRPTITQLQGIAVPYPTGTDTVLTFNAGTFSWGASGGGGGGSVTGSGFWHSTSGILDGVANVGSVGGQFSVTNAAHSDTTWVNLSGDVTNSAGTPGQITVVKLQTIPLSATSPTSGQVLGYNGTNWIPTNLPAGSVVTGSGFWHSAGGILDAAASVGTVGGQFAVTNAAHNDTIWVSLSGDITDSAATPGLLTVVGIHGNSVSPTAATPGQFLIENSSATGSAWTTITGDISASVSTTGLLTVTGIRGISVPAPSVNNTVLTFNTGALSWAVGSGGVSVTGSGFWHSTGGVLDGAASVGTVGGQFAVTNAAHNNTVWVSLSGDVTDSAATPGLLTVVKLQTIPVSATVPTTGQVLEYNGTTWIPTNLPTGSAVTGSGFWHSTSGTLDAAASVGTVGGQFAVTNAAHNNTAWVSLSGDIADSAATPGLLTVVGIQGNPVAVTAATPGQFLIENAAASGSAWTTITGDVSASVSTVGLLTTVGLRGIPLPAPSGTNTILTFNAGAYTWATPGASAAASSFVYKQGSGGTGPVIFNTLAGAVSAANTQGGPCIIEIDASLGTPTTTAIPYNFANITLIGSPDHSVQLTFITGSSITDIWQNIVNVIILSSAASPIYTPAAGVKIFIGDDSAVLNPSGTAFFGITQNGIQIIMAHDSQFGDGSVSTATVSSGKTLIIHAGDGATVNADSLAGTGAVSITASVGSTVSSTQTITGFGVSYTFQGLSLPFPTVSGTVLTYSGGAFTWGSSGSAITWNNDLSSSTPTHQYVSSISGLNGGGGIVNLNIATLNYTGGSGTITIGGKNILETNGTSTIVNAVSPGNVFLAISDNPILEVNGTTGAVSIIDATSNVLWTFTDITSTTGSGIYAQGVTPSTTNYTIASSSGTLSLNATFGGLSLCISNNPILSIIAATGIVEISDINAHLLWQFTEIPSTTISAIYAGNITPSASNFTLVSDGNLLTALQAPGANGVVKLGNNNTTLWQMTNLPSNTFPAIFATNTAPTATNYILYSDGGITALNGNVSGGQISLNINDNTFLNLGVSGQLLGRSGNVALSNATVDCTTSGNSACIWPTIVITGTITGAANIKLPAITGAEWSIDLTGATFSGGSFGVIDGAGGGGQFIHAVGGSNQPTLIKVQYTGRAAALAFALSWNN